MTISLSTTLFEDHCQLCSPFLKRLESCPRSYIFAQGELIGTTLELIWVISSFLPFLIFAIMLTHSIIKKTSRGFFMVVNLAIQQVICALLKKYIAQARPIGACSTSFGYPSGHSGFAASLATW